MEGYKEFLEVLKEAGLYGPVVVGQNFMFQLQGTDESHFQVTVGPVTGLTYTREGEKRVLTLSTSVKKISTYDLVYFLFTSGAEGWGAMAVDRSDSENHKVVILQGKFDVGRF